MWFQNDWVHDTYIAEGSEIFLNNDTYIEQSKAFYNADIIEPHSVYVNIMAAINDGGPAHTDNSRFHGRERANTPMWLLRAMTWSHLFNAYEIVQATAIWWLDDVEGGGLLYWPDGPDHPPTEHVGDMKNTALLGDNHGMFHQVGPVGPFDNGTVLVTPSAQLLPTEDNTWVVTDHDEKIYEAPLNAYRISVLWKANVYTNIDEQKHKQANPLSIEDVITIFNADLEDHGHGLRLSKENIEDESTITAMAKIYPEPKPVNALPSVFETIRK
tara:strand:- start:133 stop:945 length:813 start_codon:yes stop_codon:yes gene_type:complete